MRAPFLLGGGRCRDTSREQLRLGIQWIMMVMTRLQSQQRGSSHSREDTMPAQLPAPSTGLGLGVSLRSR